jgi:hypothetical protein
MSILHHFGQVKRKYEPYVSPVPGFRGYINTLPQYEKKNRTELFQMFGICNGSISYDRSTNRAQISDGLNVNSFTIEKDFVTEQDPYNNPLNIYNNRILLSATYIPCKPPDSYVFSFTTLTETFCKCLAVVREKMESTLWKTMDWCPFVNILDLLILKHSDTDAHLAHLEKMIVGLMDDNKTLQTKINSLEQQLSLLKKKESVVKDSAKDTCTAKEILKPEDIPIVIPTAVARPLEEVWFDLE